MHMPTVRSRASVALLLVLAVADHRSPVAS